MANTEIINDIIKKERKEKNIIQEENKENIYFIIRFI